MAGNVSQQIRVVIAHECGLKQKSVTSQTLFMANPSFSYFDCVSALFTLQHKLGVSLPESDYAKYNTVGSLTRCIIKQLKDKSK